MGLSDAEVGARHGVPLTAEQIDALAERHRERDRRADYRAALVASVLANVNRDPKKRAEPFTPFEFMPDPWPQEKSRGTPRRAQVNLSPQEMIDRVRAINAALGGEDKTLTPGPE